MSTSDPRLNSNLKLVYRNVLPVFVSIENHHLVENLNKVSRKILKICDLRIHEKTWWARYSVSNWGTPKPFSLPKPTRSGCQKPCWTSPPTSPLLCALMDTHSCMCAHFTPKPQLKREWGFWLLMLIHAIWFNKGKILSSQFVDLIDR